jgi:hypothetical protein
MHEDSKMLDDDTSAMQVRVSGSLRERVENWRRQQSKIPPLSETLRALIERGLDDEPARSTEDTAAA